jgi:hypothetical protein
VTYNWARAGEEWLASAESDGPGETAGKITMIRLNVDEARCAALFASWLQRSDAPTAAAVAEAASWTVRQFGIRGCADRMAQEFGDHPDAAVDRMRWIRQLVGETHARPTHLATGGVRHAA